MYPSQSISERCGACALRHLTLLNKASHRSIVVGWEFRGSQHSICDISRVEKSLWRTLAMDDAQRLEACEDLHRISRRRGWRQWFGVDCLHLTEGVALPWVLKLVDEARRVCELCFVGVLIDCCHSNNSRSPACRAALFLPSVGVGTARDKRDACMGEGHELASTPEQCWDGWATTQDGRLATKQTALEPPAGPSRDPHKTRPKTAFGSPSKWDRTNCRFHWCHPQIVHGRPDEVSRRHLRSIGTRERTVLRLHCFAERELSLPLKHSKTTVTRQESSMLPRQYYWANKKPQTTRKFMETDEENEEHQMRERKKGGWEERTSEPTRARWELGVIHTHAVLRSQHMVERNRLLSRQMMAKFN